MALRGAARLVALLLVAGIGTGPVRAQSPVQSSSSSSTSSKQIRKPLSGVGSALDSGVVSNGVYRNAAFGFSCKIPAGWVLRTEEVNARDDESNADSGKAAPDSRNAGRVLLAAF